MKLSLILILLIGSSLVVSCTTKPSVAPDSKHLTEGTRLINKGLVWYEKGCFEQALKHFNMAHESYALSDQVDGVAMSLNNIGSVWRELKNFSTALAYFQQAYDGYDQLEDLSGMARSLSNMAATLIQMGHYDRAAQAIEGAMSIAANLQDKEAIYVTILQNKAVLLTKKGELDEAEQLLGECIAKKASLGISGQGALYFAFGNLMFEVKRYDEAVAAFHESISLDRQVGYYPGIAEGLLRVGLVYSAINDKAKAAASFKRSIKIFALMDFDSKVNEVMPLLQSNAVEAGVDISLIESFINDWKENRLHIRPCGR